MKTITAGCGVLVLVCGLLFQSAVLAGSMSDGAKKADQGLTSAGQKVNRSTKGARDATDAAGKKTASATKSGADKVGGFFKKTEGTVEGWMKGLEKKLKD